MKLTAMAAATNGLLGTQASLALPIFEDTTSGIQWNKAPCRFCGTGCHVQVGVEDGRIVAIAGDQQAAVNKGLLCVKGYHVGSILYGEDRLTQPLLRDGEAFVPITWDEAIDIVARKIMESPDRFALYGSGQWTIPEGYAAQKFMKGGLSNNNIDPNARLCMASAVTGFIASYGVDEPAGCYEDLDECDVLITWGNNPAEMHPVLFSRVIDRRARGEDVLLIDISTRRTRTTEKAQEHLKMLPHGDVAIALGICHLLIKNRTWDENFVDNHCNFRGEEATNPTLKGEAITFEEYKRRIARYTPEYVETLSGVPQAQIHMLADLFGRRDLRITSLWCMGMNQHTMGTAVNSLVHGVHLLSGHFGKKGDAPTSLTGQPSACGTVREVGTLCHALPGGRLVTKPEHRAQAEKIWNVESGRINPVPGAHTVKMWEQFTTPGDQGGDIDTIWVQVSNPGQTLPNLNKLFDRKNGLDDKFLIVSEVYPTATTRLADLILPASMWVEKNGIVGNSERRTQQWFKQVEPPSGARDDCWMTIAVAHRLMELGHPGMKDADDDFLFAVADEHGADIPIWDWNRYYDVNVDRSLFEEYRAFTTLKQKNLAPYDIYAEERGLRWPVVETEPGVWRETKYRFTEFDDPFVQKGSGIDFYQSTTKDGRAQVWFHDYKPPPEVPDDEYPFWLCTGRVLEHWHSGTMTRRVPQLNRAMPTGYVEIHPDDASASGFHNGERVIVESRRGQVELPIWINGRGRTQPGMVFVPFFDESKLINNVTLEAFDPFSKQPDYKKCAVRVRKLTAQATHE